MVNSYKIVDTNYMQKNYHYIKLMVLIYTNNNFTNFIFFVPTSKSITPLLICFQKEQGR